MKKEESIPQADRLDGGRQEKDVPFFATRKGRGWSALLLVAILAAVLAYHLNKGGTVLYEMDQERFAVTCGNRLPEFIAYEDIAGVELASTFQMGQVIESQAWDAGWCGTYQNETYGRFTLYAYSQTGMFIIVRHPGGALIFNDKSERATTAAYEKLLERCGRRAKQTAAHR